MEWVQSFTIFGALLGKMVWFFNRVDKQLEDLLLDINARFEA